MYQLIFLSFHLIWGIFKIIHTLPVFIQLFIYLILLPKIYNYLYPSSIRPVNKEALSQHINHSPSITLDCHPQALENELFFLVFTFLFSSFDDPMEHQAQKIKCEKVGRSWFRIARSLRQVVTVANISSSSNPNIQQVCSTISSLYLYEDPRFQIWESFRSR